ncbi:MAG: 30S ribosomal protein S20 [Pirellulaceae bacterium]|nr:MAG: 30S ribosomal protein S20 [Pirellulaceae bacterium]
MPTTRSAKKRLRQNVKRRMHNRAIKSTIKTYAKRVLQALAAQDIAKAEAEYREFARRIDRAATHRVLHPNAAARRKSRLQARIKAAKQAQASASTA